MIKYYGGKIEQGVMRIGSSGKKGHNFKWGVQGIIEMVTFK